MSRRTILFLLPLLYVAGYGQNDLLSVFPRRVPKPYYLKKMSLIFPDDQKQMPVWKYGIGSQSTDTLPLTTYYHKQQATGEDTLFYFLGAGASEQYLLPFETGSQVLLNAGSFLQFANLNNGKKKLIIKGEIYLTTANDSIWIEVEGSIVKAGRETKINIQNYPDESIIVITLIQGTVEIEHQEKTIQILHSDSEICINKITEQITTGRGHAKRACAWVYGRMGAPDLSSALKRLRRWYDYTIFYNNADVENGRVVEFPYRITSVDEMLRMYQRANPELEFIMYKGGITLTKVRSPHFEESSYNSLPF